MMHQPPRTSKSITLWRPNSPIYRLPFDILYKIFLICVNDDPKFPVTASSVCQAWRNSAIQTKLLWTAIEFVDSPSLNLAWEQQKLWIDRSEDSLLDLVINHTPNQDKRTLKFIKSIFQITLPHAPRWRSFTVKEYLPPKTLRVLGDRLGDGRFHNLESISLSGSYYIGHWRGPHLLHPTPRLKHVEIYSMPIDYTSQLFDNLTTLSLVEPREMTPQAMQNLILNLLARSPGLKDLTIGITWAETLRWRSIPTLPTPDILIHDNIRTMNVPRSSSIDGVVSRIKMPVLQALDGPVAPWSFDHTTLLSIADGRPFPNLIEFYVHCPGEDRRTTHLWRALASMPQLKRVRLESFDLEGDPDNDLNSLSIICPCLEVLELMRCGDLYSRTLRSLVSARRLSTEMCSLKHISLRGTRFYKQYDDMRWLKQLPELKLIVT